jgi:D-lactate dehydrogenase
MSRVITFFEAKDWEKEEYLRRLKERLGERFQDFEVKFVSYTLNKESSREHGDTEIAVIYLNSVVDEEVLDQMKNLKFVITRTTGMDHIDILACKRRGIEVANMPVYASVTVAEQAIALMFALARRLRTAVVQDERS